jgi:hypothetical protein
MALNFRSVRDAVRSTLRLLDRLAGPGSGSSGPAATKPRPSATARTKPRPSATARTAPGTVNGTAPSAGITGRYPGDFHGTASVLYAPAPNGRPEPGEIVWTWVPYEEDYSQGKDRPVLLVASSGRYLLGLMLTSKDHDGDARRADDYVDLGTGPWDRQGRPSEAKLDRILQISPRDVRREGAILDAGRFSVVAAALRSRHGWR